MKTYSELITIPSFIDRFRYLKLNGRLGEETFGFDRWLNQVFYNTPEWKEARRKAILRDEACDLAFPDRPAAGRVVVHHMNPITEKDIAERSDFLLNPEYLITCMISTHNAIHYGDESLLLEGSPIVRAPNDQCPWR